MIAFVVTAAGNAKRSNDPLLCVCHSFARLCACVQFGDPGKAGGMGWAVARVHLRGIETIPSGGIERPVLHPSATTGQLQPTADTRNCELLPLSSCHSCVLRWHLNRTRETKPDDQPDQQTTICMIEYNRIRTCNRRIRGPTRYPLRHIPLMLSSLNVAIWSFAT